MHVKATPNHLRLPVSSMQWSPFVTYTPHSRTWQTLLKSLPRWPPTTTSTITGVLLEREPTELRLTACSKCFLRVLPRGEGAGRPQGTLVWPLSQWTTPTTHPPTHPSTTRRLLVPQSRSISWPWVRWVCWIWRRWCRRLPPCSCGPAVGISQRTVEIRSNKTEPYSSRRKFLCERLLKLIWHISHVQ